MSLYKRIPADVLAAFYYAEDSKSGLKHVFTNKQRAAGQDAGCLDNKGYWRVKFNRIPYRASRVVWTLFYGEIPSQHVIDHIDGNTQNNCIANLRIVKQADNCRNSRKRKDNSSGVTGVSLNTNGKTHYWIARFRDKSKSFSIKTYGVAGAKALALAWRERQKDDALAEGIKFSERHGE